MLSGDGDPSIDGNDCRVATVKMNTKISPTSLEPLSTLSSLDIVVVL